jgi:hypothetical protein
VPGKTGYRDESGHAAPGQTGFLQRVLASAELPVAGIAKTWHDVPFGRIVRTTGRRRQVIIQCCEVDIDVRVSLDQTLHSLGRTDNAYKLYAAGSPLFQDVHCGHR